MASLGENFNCGDRVTVDVMGDRSVVVQGIVAGIAQRHIIDLVIVILDTPNKEWTDASGNPWKAIAFPNTGLKKIDA